MLVLINAIKFPDWIHKTAINLPGPLSIQWYGLAYIAGLFLAFYYANKTATNPKVWIPKQKTLLTLSVPDRKLLEDFLYYCLFGIIVGGRVGYVLLYGLDGFLEHPLSIFKVWEGGMSFHGGFLGVCIATLILARQSKMSLSRLADMAAISAPIGLGLGRLANFVNQELWGRPTDVPWAVIFDENGYPGPPRHPSQLYEAFLEGFVIFMVLYLATRKGKILTKPGMSTGLFLIMYGCFRILVEFVRVPDAPLFGPLTRGMTYSIPMVIIGIVVFSFALKRPAFGPKALERPTETDHETQIDDDSA